MHHVMSKVLHSFLFPRMAVVTGFRSHSHTDPFGSNDRGGKAKPLSEHQQKMMARGLPKKQRLSGVEHVVLVASGKGGVGKSTTAVNLAIALKQQLGGSGVGLLDMDMFGPSLPIMMNLSHKPELDKDNKMIPLLNYGIHCMSVGLLVPQGSGVVWRGPMVMSAVQRLLLHTAWPALRWLVLDLPPGTGDVALSITQLLHVTGAVLVSTPQDVALADVIRGADMFKQVGVPVLGVVQNMSVHVCSNCGHTEHIFGKDGLTAMAAQLDVPVLGEVPLSGSIRQSGDTGRPITVADPDSPQARCYQQIATQLQHTIEGLEEKV